MLTSGGLVETQATAEKDSYSRAELNAMLDLAEAGIRSLLEIQQTALAAAL
jgi:ribonuclease PH